MVLLGLEPRVPGWKIQTNPLSYGGTQIKMFIILYTDIIRYSTPILREGS